jgi:hypothetical protein
MIGTRKWIAETLGDLSWLDRGLLMSTIIGLRLKARFQPALPKAWVDNDRDFALPDTKLVRLAIEECTECCSEAISHHCFRTFFWSVLLARIAAVEPDREELAVASLLHDLELGKLGTRSLKNCHCFAGAGASSADAWLTSHGVAQVARDNITQAIAMHLNPGVSLEYGATPHLLNLGAMADVVGTRMSAIPADQRRRVLAEHPRCGFKQEMKQLMRAERDGAPKTRAGFLMSIGFEKMIEAAPFGS